MPKFSVNMSTNGFYVSSAVVEAGTEDEAKEKALELATDHKEVVWYPGGVDCFDAVVEGPVEQIE